MKTKEFVELEKRLLANFPGFAIKGNLMFISPVDHTLRGFHYEPSGFAKRAFYVNMFFIPLCVPIKHTHLTFGHRVGQNKRWNADRPDLEAALASEMAQEVDFLNSLKAFQDVAKALEPLTKRHNPHCHEAFAYTLIQAGQIRAATEALAALSAHINTAVAWHHEIALRAQLIRDKLLKKPEDAQGQLIIWEAETARSLGLEAYRKPSSISLREGPWDSISM